MVRKRFLCSTVASQLENMNYSLEQDTRTRLFHLLEERPTCPVKALHHLAQKAVKSYVASMIMFMAIFKLYFVYNEQLSIHFQI